MTWLHGSTTHTLLQDKLTKLIAGEVADDSSVTVPVGTAWLRDAGGEDFLSTPASVAYTIPNTKYRTGYWLPIDVKENTFLTGWSAFAIPFSSMQSNHASFCRTSTIASALSSGTRVLCKVTVTTPNSVAGDYSTLRFTAASWNMDTGALIASNTAQAPNSSGVLASTFGTLTSHVLTFGNPDTGIVPNGATWVRCFDTTYKGGIDAWPMWKHRQNGVTTTTYATPPPGTITTDYAIVEYSSFGANAVNTSAHTIASNASTEASFASGLGIKTATGLGSGALYEVVGWSCCRTRIRILGGANAVTAGTVDCEVHAGAANNPFSSTYGRVGGSRINQWLRAFKTSASVVNGDTIEYYVSVKADQIVVVLQGNPAATALGKLTVAGILAIRTDVDSGDHFPVMSSHFCNDYTADNTTVGTIGHAKHLLFDQKGCDSPSRDVVVGSVRDWYTGWARPELWKGTFGQSGAATGFSDFSTSLNGAAWTGGKLSNTSGIWAGDIPVVSFKPNPLDSKWWLYPIGYIDAGIVNPAETNYVSTDPTAYQYKRMYRGATDESVCWLPDFGWSSGDELYEAATGKRWLLIKPDYDGIAMRARYSANTFAGGYAILET